MKTKESLKNQIYNAILNGILSGEFKPEQILTERELWINTDAAKLLYGKPF